MKMSYKTQLWISVAAILLANIAGTILKHWIFRSVGFVACGLLWIIHPVLPTDVEASEQIVFWTRIAGVILIFIGLLTRSYTY